MRINTGSAALYGLQSDTFQLSGGSLSLTGNAGRGLDADSGITVSGGNLKISGYPSGGITAAGDKSHPEQGKITFAGGVTDVRVPNDSPAVYSLYKIPDGDTDHSTPSQPITQGSYMRATTGGSPVWTPWGGDNNETVASAFSTGLPVIDSTAFYLVANASNHVHIEPKENYVIAQGQHGQWIKSSGVGLGFTANGDYVKFHPGGSVSVDGAMIANSNYTSRSGSTIVTLNAAYLETLSVGLHTLRIYFTDGYAETDFLINAAGGEDVPETGDATTPMLWVGLMLLAGAGLAVNAIRRRRQSETKADG